MSQMKSRPEQISSKSTQKLIEKLSREKQLSELDRMMYSLAKAAANGDKKLAKEYMKKVQKFSIR